MTKMIQASSARVTLVALGLATSGLVGGIVFESVVPSNPVSELARRLTGEQAPLPRAQTVSSLGRQGVPPGTRKPAPLAVGEAVAELSRLGDRTDDPEASDQLSDVLRTIDPKNIPTVLRGLDDLGKKRSNSAAAGSLLKRWARKDPQAALSYVRQRGDIGERGDGLSIVYASWAALEPKSALTAARQLPPGAERKIAIRCSLDGMAALAPGEAWALVTGEFKTELSDSDLIGLIRSWARNAPAQAAAHALQLPNRHFRRSAIVNIVDSWFADDPNATAGWVRSLPPGFERAEATKQLATEMSKQNPSLAWSFVCGLPNDALKSEAQSGVLSTLARIDLAAAARLIADIPRGRERNRITGNVLEAWSEQDLHAALTWSESLPPDEQRIQAIAGVFSEWVKTDVAGASAYALKLPGGPLQSQSIARVIGGLAERDVPSVGSFLRNCWQGLSETKLRHRPWVLLRDRVLRRLPK